MGRTEPAEPERTLVAERPILAELERIAGGAAHAGGGAGTQGGGAAHAGGGAGTHGGGAGTHAGGPRGLDPALRPDGSPYRPAGHSDHGLPTADIVDGGRWSADGSNAAFGSQPLGDASAASNAVLGGLPGDASRSSVNRDGGQAPYVLRTRAAEDGYAGERAKLRDAADALRQSSLPSVAEPQAVPTPAAPELPEFTLLTCLPGPLAIVRLEDDLLAVDLRALRSHLVYRRLVQDIGGGDVQAQGLLRPAVIELPKADVALCVERQEDLSGLGLVVEAFGEDALLVRAVPAHLRDCVDEPDVADLVHKILPWMRVKDRDRDDALKAMAKTTGADPAPRLARRWLRELLAEGVDLGTTPGIRRFSPEDLGLGS